jgi:hypothetical protein
MKTQIGSFILLGACLHREPVSTDGLSNSSAFLIQYLEQGLDIKDPELRIQAWKGMFVLAKEERREALFLKALEDSERLIREQAVALVWRQGDLALLQKAQRHDGLTDGEKCLLALDVFSLNEGRSIGLWPIISESTLEDQYFCALAASTIIDLNTPWQDLLKTGDYPLSIPFVDSVVSFGTPENLALFETELEWAEEGIRASLWASWILVDPSRLSLLIDVMKEFSEEECLEMVDLSWRYPEVGGTKTLLRYLQKEPGFCGDLAATALLSQGEKNLLGIEKRIKEGSRDEVVSLVISLKEYPFSSPKQQREIRTQLEDFLSYDQDPLILLASLDTLAFLGDKGSQKKMRNLLENKLDLQISIAIEKSHNQIEIRKGIEK